MLMTASDVNSDSIDKVFDRICVISLTSREDRRRDVTNELGRIGLKPGVSVTQFFDAIKPVDAGSFPSIGARGCFMSHLSILENAINDGVNAILILEDDVAFTRDGAKRMPIIVDFLRNGDWDVFYGGYKEIFKEADAGVDQCLVLVDPDFAVGLTHCIGFRGASISEAASFLKAMLDRPAGSPEGGPMHVDGAYSWYRRAYPERRTLAALPAIANQRPSRSDVYEGIAWYDRFSFLGPLILIVRRWKHRLRRK